MGDALFWVAVCPSCYKTYISEEVTRECRVCGSKRVSWTAIDRESFKDFSRDKFVELKKAATAAIETMSY